MTSPLRQRTLALCGEYIKGVKSGSKGTSLEVQWLRLCASNAGGTGSIPSQGTKVPHVT